MSTPWVFEVERHFSVLHVDLFVEALDRKWYSSLYGLDYSCSHYKIVRGREYWRGQDYEVYNQVLEDAYKQSPNFLQDYALRTQRACEGLAEVTEYVAGIDWSLHSDEDLQNEWYSFSQAMLAVCTAINGRPVEFIQERIYPVLETLREQGSWTESIEEVLGIISNVDRPLAYRDEPLALLKVAALVQQRPEFVACFRGDASPQTILSEMPEELRLILEEHRKKYAWLNHPYASYRQPFTVLDFVQRLQHLATRSSSAQEVARIEALREADRERFEQILRSAKNQDHSSLIQATRDFAFLRTHMAEVFDRAIVIARETLLGEIGKRLSLSDAQMVSMTLDEIQASIAQHHPSVETEELDLRAEAFAYVFEAGQKRVVTRDEIYQYEEAEESQSDDTSVSSVNGMVANPGVVTGSAKVLLGPQDNWKVNAGDIIIATMTTPEYIAAMEKAAAFVTDEGGITCHAAITSREFNVPCIVGTYIATKVFRDNDIVCVDTDQNVVYRV